MLEKEQQLRNAHGCAILVSATSGFSTAMEAHGKGLKLVFPMALRVVRDNKNA